MKAYTYATRPQGNMGFFYLSSTKSVVPFLPYNSKAYGRVLKYKNKKRKEKNPKELFLDRVLV